MPLFVLTLLRLNRQYEREAQLLEHDVPAAAIAPILRRHVVLVFIDRLDMAGARAIQYARTLTPDELRVVHFALDEAKARELADEWSRTGLDRVPLEIVDCPDRRLLRAAVECVARELANGETEVSVLLPDRKYRGLWHRVLHDRTADSILREVSRLPHANVTTIPFHLHTTDERQVSFSALTGGHHGRGDGRGPEIPLPALADAGPAQVISVSGCSRIGDARWRQRGHDRRARPLDARVLVERCADAGAGARRRDGCHLRGVPRPTLLGGRVARQHDAGRGAHRHPQGPPGHHEPALRADPVVSPAQSDTRRASSTRLIS